MGFVVFSSQLAPVSEYLQRRVVTPKLVRAGRIHPSQAARAVRGRSTGVLISALISAGCAAVLWRAGSHSFVLLVSFSTLVVPVARALAWPRVWPVPALLVALFAAAYYRSGVDSLAVGLLLFHLSPMLAGLASRVAGWPGAVGVWVLIAAAVAPIAVLAAVALIEPSWLDHALRNIGKPGWETFWEYADRLALFMGATDSSGQDPYKTLGLSHGADEKAVRKRFRQLSRQYHPDKTGGDVQAREYFMKLQSAMALITEGGFNRANAKEMIQERFIGLVKKCVELVPVVGMWAVLGGMGAVGALLRYAAARRRAKLAAAAGHSEAEAAVAGAGNAKEAAEGVYRLGADFVGAGALGIQRSIVDDMAPPEGEAGPGMNVDPALARPTKGVLSGKQGSQVVGGVRRGTAKARPNRRR